MALSKECLENIDNFTIEHRSQEYVEELFERRKEIKEAEMKKMSIQKIRDMLWEFYQDDK